MTERTFRIHIAAQMSGVSEDLIRAWERRYGVVKPNRTASGYRVYSEQDVALLRRLKQLTQEGMSIAEASSLVPQLRSELVQTPVRAFPQQESVPLAAWKGEILEAAKEGDQRRVQGVLDEAFSAISPLRAFDGLLRPLLEEVGTLWEGGTLSVAQEHLVSQAVRTRLSSLLHSAPQGTRRHAICACFPEELHEIGLLGVALRFRHSGMRVTYLGQRTPVEDLASLGRALRADLIALSCVIDPGPEQFRRTLSVVREAMPQAVVVVGGPGIDDHGQLAEELGVRTHRSDADWATALA